MRIVLFLLAAAAIAGWLGFELRSKDKAVSNVLYFFSALFACIFLGAIFGLY